MREFEQLGSLGAGFRPPVAGPVQHWASVLSAYLPQNLSRRVILTDGAFPSSLQYTAGLLDFLVPAVRSRGWAAWLARCAAEGSSPALHPTSARPTSHLPGVLLGRLLLCSEVDRPAELRAQAQARDELVVVDMVSLVC